MKKRTLALITLAAGLFLAFGCGGSTPTQELGFASVKALVVEHNGQTTGLEGHAFTMLQTAETAVSAPDGSLTFRPAPPGIVTLRLVSAGSVPSDPHHGSAAEGGDPDDAERANHAEVHLERVQAEERIEVRMHICNGEMTCVRVSRQLRGERDVEIEMQRTDENDDPDMEGELELERDVDRQEFEVEVEHADTGRELELVVIDTDGTEESQGVRTVDADGEAAWKMDTEDGDRLPFDAADLDDLEGCDVEVRDANTDVVLLVATVPEMPPPAGPGEDPSGGADEDRLRGCALLTAAEPGLEGYVEIRSRDDGDCEAFQMEATKLAAGREVEFFVEDPEAAGSMLSLGTRTAQGNMGKAHLGLSTVDGDVLPGGVSAVVDLVGLRVEIRDADTEDMLLYGTIPEMIAD